MFIEDVVSKVWEPVSKKYIEEYEKAKALDDGQLYAGIKEKLSTHTSCVYKNEWLNMTSLNTSGCPHKVNKGKFGGCSMCNYFSEDVEYMAMISLVKDRNPSLYAEILRICFEYSRGKGAIPNVFEYVNGYDSLSTEEFPQEAFDELFAKASLFSTKPYRLIFEARAPSISKERLKVFKEKSARNVEIAFGVEVYDEWIRNHWLNKNISNQEIVAAIQTIKECRCYSRANLLIGMPGLTEEQSMELLLDSVSWLKGLEVDFITLSPLVCREMTLQSLIYSNLRHNAAFKDTGIIGGSEDGTQSIFFVFDAIYAIMSDRDLINKVVFAPVNFMQYFSNKRNYFKYTEQEAICSTIINALNVFDTKRDFCILAETKKAISKDNNYLVYLERKKQQADRKKIMSTLHVVAEEVAKGLWCDSWETKVSKLLEEIKHY